MKTLKWGLLYTAAFLAAFVGSALLKMNSDPTHGKYNTRWDETVGKVYTDLPYGEGAANKFDLYVPADKSQDAYGLVVYLHAGGFTSGDKAGDAEMLKWLCSKGYVAAGILHIVYGRKPGCQRIQPVGGDQSGHALCGCSSRKTGV